MKSSIWVVIYQNNLSSNQTLFQIDITNTIQAMERAFCVFFSREIDTMLKVNNTESNRPFSIPWMTYILLSQSVTNTFKFQLNHHAVRGH